jgi:hypothetical protein
MSLRRYEDDGDVQPPLKKMKLTHESEYNTDSHKLSFDSFPEEIILCILKYYDLQLLKCIVQYPKTNEATIQLIMKQLYGYFKDSHRTIHSIFPCITINTTQSTVPLEKTITYIIQSLIRIKSIESLTINWKKKTIPLLKIDDDLMLDNLQRLEVRGINIHCYASELITRCRNLAILETDYVRDFSVLPALKRLTYIRSNYLSQLNNIDKCIQLAELDISAVNSISKECENSIFLLPNLRTLKINTCLSQFNSNLKSLELIRTDSISNEIIIDILKLKYLNTLRLKYVPTDATAFPYFASNNTITNLDIDNYGVSFDPCIESYIVQNQTIRHLKVHKMDSLFEVEHKLFQQLESFSGYINNTEIDRFAKEALNLTTLELFSENIPIPMTGILMLPSLTKLTLICSLDKNENLTIPFQNTTIKYLDLSKCKYLHPEHQLSLMKNTSIETLILPTTLFMKTEEIMHLMNMKSLRTLTLTCIDISDKMLTSIIQQNKHIQYLYLHAYKSKACVLEDLYNAGSNSLMEFQIHFLPTY